MAAKWHPKPREIYRVDLREIINNPDTSATYRICVVLEVDEKARRMLAIFTSWDHDSRGCHCITPGTSEAAPFGHALYKISHFSIRNVVSVPIDKIIERIGSDRVTVDEYDRLDVVAQRAVLAMASKKIAG